MKKYKLNFRAYFFLLLFKTIIILILCFTRMFLNNEIAATDEISPKNKTVVILILLCICFLYIFSTITLLKNILFYRGVGITFTNRGIENTFICINIAAIILVIPIKHIPWKTIVSLKEVNGRVEAKIDVQNAKFNCVTKKYLKSHSFVFAYPYVTPIITSNDLQQFTEVFGTGLDSSVSKESKN